MQKPSNTSIGVPIRIIRSLQHQRRNRADLHRFGNAVQRLTILRNVARHLAAAGGMADMHRISQVQMPGGNLTGAAVPPAVMGDDAIATVEENNSWLFLSSALSGQPWWNMIGCASRGPQSL